MRRLSDVIMMIAVGLMTVGLLLGGIASSAHVAGPGSMLSSDYLWIVTGFAGFALGLSWRFLFWDLPAIIWDVFMINRRNLQYLCIIGAGVAILVFI